VAAPGLRNALAPEGSSPFSSVDSAIVFSREGDAQVSTLTFDDQTGVFLTEFDATSATINAEDGVLAVIYATIGAGTQPGNCWDLNLSDLAADTFLTDPDDDDQVIEIRNGQVCVRAGNAPYEFEVDGGKVHPGSGAMIELGTAEPFSISSGRVVIDYDPSLFTAPLEVQTDARHGASSVTTSFPQLGRIQIDFSSVDESLNGVPGDLLRIHGPTDPDVAIPTISPLTIVAAESFLNGPGGAPLAVAWVSDTIEFAHIPGVYSDDFETGDYWIWSSVTTP
jgi:hypothetical protein